MKMIIIMTTEWKWDTTETNQQTDWGGGGGGGGGGVVDSLHKKKGEQPHV